MKKVAIFVEGQTEQIFVGKLLHQLYGYQGIRVVSEKIHGKSLFIRVQEGQLSDVFDYLFLVINVDTDERVLSAMIENAPNMAEKGFCKILGLRDLYPRPRAEKELVLQAVQRVLDSVPQSEMMRLVLAVMEVEAWFLAEPQFFERIDPQLTTAYVRTMLGIDLENIDPEEACEHPARVVKDIYDLAGLRYRKRAADTHKIAESIDYDALCLDAHAKGKIHSFFLFVHEIETIP